MSTYRSTLQKIVRHQTKRNTPKQERFCYITGSPIVEEHHIIQVAVGLDFLLRHPEIPITELGTIFTLPTIYLAHNEHHIAHILLGDRQPKRIILNQTQIEAHEYFAELAEAQMIFDNSIEYENNTIKDWNLNVCRETSDTILSNMSKYSCMVPVGDVSRIFENEL